MSRSYSRSPSRSQSSSPRRSRTPPRRRDSRSPPRRQMSRSPPRRQRSRSPPRRRRSPERNTMRDRDDYDDIPIGHQSRRRDNGRTLFFKGAPYKADEMALLEHRAFSQAVSCRLIRDSKGQSRGFGYLLFKNDREAERAYDRREQTEVDGFYLYLDFCGDRARNPRNEYYLDSQRKMARAAEEAMRRRSPDRSRYRSPDRDRYRR